MRPEHSLGDVFITVNGEPMGMFQSINASINVERVPENTPEERRVNRLFNKEFSMTLKDVKVSEGFIEELLHNETYTLVGRGYRLPRGNKLPKKKRIRNKWKKKYGYEFKLENVSIGAKK